MLLRGNYGWRGLFSEIRIQLARQPGAADGRRGRGGAACCVAPSGSARLGAARHDTDWSQPVSSEVIDAKRANVPLGGPRQGDAAAHMLELADAAAARGDYADALAWLGGADVIGDGLDPVYEGRRARWQLNVETDRVGPSQWFG